MKKLYGLIAFIFCLFVIFIIAYYSSHNYELEYNINKIKVTEKYDKNKQVYLFSFFIDEEEYFYSVYKKYTPKRNLIHDVQVKEKNDNTCFFITSEYIEDFNFCSNGAIYTTPYYDEQINSKLTDSYKNIDIYSIKEDDTYFIWNYNEFLVITNDDKKSIKLFNNDIYQLDLITTINEDIVIADYDQEYTFNQLLLINSKRLKPKKINLNKKMYFNSYILGTNKDYIYLYDLQKKQEYMINPYKETVKKEDYIFFDNNEKVKTSAQKLDKKNIFFKNDDMFVLKNDQLFYMTPYNEVLVSDQVVKKIVHATEKEAYFISEDSLYYVNIYEGIEKVFSYSEWKFNYTNIYVFNNK